MKNSKTIRIDKTVLTKLIDKAEDENRSLSNVIETVCKDYFSILARKEFCVDGVKYMPVHMTNNNIYQLFEKALSIVSKIGDCSVVRVRRHHGSKGVAFCIDFYGIDENNIKSLSRRYTFSIDPNWEILDFFDHWTHGYVPLAEKEDKSYASERINVSKYFDNVIKQIQEELVEIGEPVKNQIFYNDEWTEVYYNHEKYLLEE